MRFSHVFSPHGLNNILFSQSYILETVPVMRTVGRMYIPTAGEKVRSLRLPRSHPRINWWSHPLDDLLQEYCA